MASFRGYLSDCTHFGRILAEFNGVPSAQAGTQPQVQPLTAKPWSAKKPEVLQMWRNLRPDTPIIMAPVASGSAGGDHSSYGEDGIRVTGSWWFIASVLARLKELLAYENPQNKLRLIFRGVGRDHGTRPDRQSFVFYAHLEQRSRGRPGRPRNQTA